MKQKHDCTLTLFSYSSHLQQIYSGFNELRLQGLINLHVTKAPTFDKHSNKPLLLVTVDNKHQLLYDTLDSDKAIFDDMDLSQVNYYFKRSYNPEYINSRKENVHFFPLGLNYYVKSRKYHHLFEDRQKHIKDLLFHNSIGAKIIHTDQDSRCYISDFEHGPAPSANPKILFSTRTWDPSEPNVILSEFEKNDRIMLNDARAEYIRKCQSEFGKQFYGGFYPDEFAKIHYPDCLLSVAKKTTFMNKVKESDICIATTGLHNSIGWKFGEYVAASRVILSEPIHQTLPGPFEKEINFYEFRTSADLIKIISILVEDTDLRLKIMKANHSYYTQYLRPDKLVLNTLLKIERKI